MPHYTGEADYSIGSLPVTEKLVDQEFNFLQPHLSAPNGPDQMEQFLDAVTKVVDNIGDLERLPDRLAIGRGDQAQPPRSLRALKWEKFQCWKN